MKRKFKREELQAILWEDDEDSEVVLDEIVDKSRWSIISRLVFKKDGKLWETTYSSGATESQDERPFENDPDEIEVQEVEAYARTMMDYRSVE